MPEANIKSTRLRYVSAKTAHEVSQIIDRLPFKVEIKGGPVFAQKRWFIFFVIPEIVGLDFDNLDM